MGRLRRRWSGLHGASSRLTDDLRAFPRQFWILVIGTFVYTGAAALGFPFEGLYMSQTLHISLTMIGVVFGLVTLAVMPFQMLGGTLTDRFGRKSMMMVAAVSATIWFLGFAWSHHAWQVAILVGMEGAFGWPLFQTAANAMTADLLPEGQRAEGFSVLRTAMNAGVVGGPPIGGLALALGASYRQLFVAAAIGCVSFLGLTAVFIRETRPESAMPPRAPGRCRRSHRLGDRLRRRSSAAVLRRGRAAGLLLRHVRRHVLDLHRPVPAHAEDHLGPVAGPERRGRGAVRLPGHAGREERRPHAAAVGVESVRGGRAGRLGLRRSRLELYALVCVFSLGEVLFGPVASAVVSDLAPEAIRGRYNGAWTIVWNGGASLGPAFGGWSMQTLGGRQTFGIVFFVGLIGAALFLLLRGRVVPRAPRSRGPAAAEAN